MLQLRFDLSALRGTGAAGEPVGIRNVAGLTAAPSLGANGSTPSYDNLKDTVANVRAANAPFTTPGWVFHPRTINTLEKLKDSTGRYLATAGLLEFDSTGVSGRLLNFPFRTSSQIPTNITTGTSTDTSEIYFSSDWNEAWVGSERTLETAVSRDASYSSDGTTGGGITMEWTINGQIGPHTRAGVDANGWLWEIGRDREARRVLVEVSGTAQAVDERTLPDETREVLQTQGESELRKVLQMDEPPRIIKCGTTGCLHVSAEDAAKEPS